MPNCPPNGPSKPTRRWPAIACAVVLLLGAGQFAHGFAFIFAGEASGVDIVSHPVGYTGSGGTLSVTVGIDPTSVNITKITTAVQNVVNTWNAQLPTTGELRANILPSGYIDFESVLLHEMGHALGLAHINLASESGLGTSQQNGTKSTEGVDNTYNVGAGADGVYGSADDVRGDDVNLNYFRIADNDPFDINLGVVDSTTYSRDVADLPTGDTYAANAERSVGNLMGYTNTEAAMQQGTFAREIQRTLGADDVAGILYAQTGIDEIAGTSDDYLLELMYIGEDAAADIVIDFDASQTSFAVTQVGGTQLKTGRFPRQQLTNHFALTSASIYFDPTENWTFSLLGDLDSNNLIDDRDIDYLFAQINAASPDLIADLTSDGQVDSLDADLLVEQILGTAYGDANLDALVDIADLQTLAGSFGGAGAWHTGDFDGDGSVTIADLQLMAGNFGFDATTPGSPSISLQAALQLADVPEPTSLGLLALMSLGLARRRPR